MQRFHGSVCSSRWERGTFWHHLELDEAAILLGTSGGDRRIEREAVDHLEFEPVRIPPFWWATNVRIVLANERRWPQWFVPMRSRRLRAELERLGWPVTDAETVGYRQVLGQLVGRS